jgi:hypothetical protein
MDVVSGRTTITFGDRMGACWTRRTKIMLALLSLFVAAMTVSDFPKGLTTSRDVAAVYAITTLLTILLLALVWLSCVVIGFAVVHLRSSKEQCDVAYEFAAAGLTVRDATGAAAICPWSVIVRARETRRAIRLDIRPLSSRYVPTRAFAPGDLARLRLLLSEKLGAAAKMRKQ